MPNNLGNYFHDQRVNKGLTLGQLAEKLGYRNFSKGARRITRLEREGVINELLMVKLAEALDIDLPTVEELIEKDREEYLKEWEKWVNEPVPMQMIVRYMAAVYGEKPLPEEIKTPEEAEHYACGFAKEHRCKVCLALSRRHSVWIDEKGEVTGRTEAKPGDDNVPYMKIGRHKFWMNFGW
jgi:transcriptional regulator with XRE-family HTH domain